MAISPNTKQKIAIIMDVTKTVFHWGFVPAILYLGFRRGADPGSPPLTLLSLILQ